MTLKRYMPVNCQYGAEMMEHGIGDWCDWDAVQQHVKAQRADAQREALQGVLIWARQGLSSAYSEGYRSACGDLQGTVLNKLMQLESGERIESVSQVDGAKT